jgi:putative membrane protein
MPDSPKSLHQEHESSDPTHKWRDAPRHARVPEEKRATEYLANERTFLAWIRTSIALISLGFVITRLALWAHVALKGMPEDSKHLSTSSVIGLGMMAIGAVIAMLAAWRYRVVNCAIDEGHVKADHGLVYLVTVLVVLLAGTILVFMLLNE